VSPCTDFGYDKGIGEDKIRKRFGNLNVERLVLIQRSPSGNRVVVLREAILGCLGSLSHQALLLARITLLPGSLVLQRLGATIALPEEDDSLTNKHADGAGGQASQNTQNGRDNNEAEHTGESVGESAVRVRRVVVAFVAVRGRGRRRVVEVTVLVVVVTLVVMLLGEVLEFLEGWHTLREELVVVLGRTVVASHAHHAVVLAVAALTTNLACHAQDAVLSSGQETAHARDQKLLETLGLAVALLPGETLGGRSGLLNLSLSDVELASGVLNQGNGDGVNRNRVSLKVENGESDIEEVGSRGIIGGSQRHHLQGIANGHRLRGLAIFKLLDGVNRAWGNGREDLAAVSQ
jgi:hypothetical protein